MKNIIANPQPNVVDDLCEDIRTPETMLFSDVRNRAFNVQSANDLYDDIANFSLNNSVPEVIKVQYDTARNIYLYAFHVYRFYNVAQQQLFSVLELAIKDCIGQNELQAFIKRKTTKKYKPKPGLRIYMIYIAEHKLITNEDFPTWHARNRIKARNVYQEKLEKIMADNQLDEIAWNENEIDESQFDVEWDYVAMLCKLMPELRNMFAHGSNTLDRNVLNYFQDVSIIINKIYERA